MKIVYVGLRNIMGIKELEFAPGKMTVVEGKNGRGKTSVLKGLQGAIGGGHDATLIKKGEEKGEIVVVFDDGTKLEKKIKEKNTKMTLKDKAGKEIPRAASFLKAAVDDLCVNPIKILTAPSKDRAKLLLDSIQMETPFDEIEAITKTKLQRTDTRHPLYIIQEERDKVYEERTDNNRFLKEKKNSVSQMREGIPFKTEERDFSAELKELEREAVELQTENDEIKASVGEWRMVKIDEAERVKQAAIEEAHKAFHFSCESINAEASTRIEAVTDKNNPRLIELSQKIGEAETLNSQSLKLAGQIEYIKEGEKLIRAMEDDTEKLTKTINGLDKLKASMIENLPIKGLEVKDGEIYLDGVPFDSVNKAKRIQFALSVASMRKAELPLICVDELEALDDESFKIFQEEAEKTDMQFIVTRVNQDSNLNVITE